MEKLMTAAEYLLHRYKMPKKFPELPMADEDFISAWSAKENFDVLRFLSREFLLPTENFDWKNVAALRIEFKQTLAEDCRSYQRRITMTFAKWQHC